MTDKLTWDTVEFIDGELVWDEHALKQYIIESDRVDSSQN